MTDDCQDWTLEDVTTNDGWMIVQMSRLLDTKDKQDHSIKNDSELWSPPTRIIAAWGSSDNVSFHGQNNARGSVRIFATHSNELSEMEALLETLEKGSDGYFDFTEEEFDIPAEDTYYQDLCKTFDELNINDLPEGQSMVTMIGGMFVVQNLNNCNGLRSFN